MGRPRLVQADQALAAELPGRLSQAAALSQRMLQAAESADWDALAELEQQRAGLLDDAFFSRVAALPASTRAPVASLLAECLRLNDAVAAITACHLQRLAEVIAGLQAATNQSPAREPNRSGD